MFDKVLNGLICLLISLALGTAGLLVFYISDNYSINTMVSNGIILNKRYLPATIFIGGVPVPVIINKPEGWLVDVFVADKSGEIGLSKYFWNELQINQEVEVEYGYGRISNTLYIKSLRKIKAAQ